MLSAIKILLGLTDESQDELLMLLIERCTDEFIQYTHNGNTAGCESLIASMVIYQFNRLGTEGVTSESYSGVKFDYTSDYPDNIVRQLKAHRKLVVY